jgi:hypothetical protein
MQRRRRTDCLLGDYLEHRFLKCVKAVPPSGGNNDHVAGSTLLALPADPHQQTTVKHVQNFLAVVQDTVKGSYFDVSRQTIISVEGRRLHPVRPARSAHRRSPRLQRRRHLRRRPRGVVMPTTHPRTSLLRTRRCRTQARQPPDPNRAPAVSPSDSGQLDILNRRAHP